MSNEKFIKNKHLCNIHLVEVTDLSQKIMNLKYPIGEYVWVCGERKEEDDGILGGWPLFVSTSLQEVLKFIEDNEDF